MSDGDYKSFQIAGGPYHGRIFRLEAHKCRPIPPLFVQMSHQARMGVTLTTSGLTKENRVSQEEIQMGDCDGNVYLDFRLYEMSGRESKEPVYRYIYSGISFYRIQGDVPENDAALIFSSDLIPALPASRR